jgi:hypothetical protein
MMQCAILQKIYSSGSADIQIGPLPHLVLFNYELKKLPTLQSCCSAQLDVCLRREHKE